MLCQNRFEVVLFAKRNRLKGAITVGLSARLEKKISTIHAILKPREQVRLELNRGKRLQMQF